MKDLKIDNLTNDLVISEGRIQEVIGQEEVTQRCRLHLRRLFGEWFLNINTGLAWFTNLLGGKDENAIKLSIRNELSKVSGVSQVREVSLNVNRTTRDASAAVTLTTIYGDSSQVDITEGQT